MYIYFINFSVLILNDTYIEIKESTTGSYKEKGSKFISYTFPVYSEIEVKNNLEAVKKIEYAAQHHCYAYVIKSDKSLQRTNDDGEPSSTAGKPILGQILSNNLTNILIIVVRYFGGIKLGTPGLIQSYKEATNQALLKAKFITKTLKEEYEVRFKYPEINNVMRLVKEFNLEIINTNFQMECVLTFRVPKSNSQKILESFNKNHKLSIK